MFHGWQHLTPEDRETILRGVTDGAVYGGPYHLELDWVDACNAKCFFCNSAHTHNGRSIPWERARAALEEAVAGGLRSIRLSGGGEPTLHPHFLDLLQFLSKNGIILDNLTTNGIALSDRIIDALQAVRLTDIRVSLNYPDAASWSEGMGLPEKVFERVRSQLARLDAARRGNPNFGRLMIQFFVANSTYRKIRESYALARELGVDLVTYREIYGVEPERGIPAEAAGEVIDQMREIVRADWSSGIIESHLESHGIGEAIKGIYEGLRGELGGAPPLAPQELNDPIRYCYIGWYSMTFMGNQAVYPCCFVLPHESARPLGDLGTGTLGEIWRGPGFERMRQEMRDYMLLQRRVPFFGRRVERIHPFCASHTDCPVTRSMCDEEFYEEADRRLEAIRKRPFIQAWRLINRAGRVFERKILGVKNW